jgi:DNA-directed RNA polymerase subunit RPC12/RpoP
MTTERKCSRCKAALPSFLDRPDTYCKTCRAKIVKGWRLKRDGLLPAAEVNQFRKPSYDAGPLDLALKGWAKA